MPDTAAPLPASADEGAPRPDEPPALRPLSDCLSKDELRALSRKSDLRALAGTVFTWGVIVGAFALAILWTNPLTLLAAVVILGGRQLALGILMHDCAHHSWFKGRRANEVAGHVFAAVPMGTSLAAYRSYHLEHHRHAGTPQDPDADFVKNYPVPRQSLIRKFRRDLTGQTGIRDLMGRLKRFKLARDWPWLAFHVGLLAALTLAGAPWAYLLWWAAELCVYPAVMRLRQIGEHGTAPDRTKLDARFNTGTTIAPLWQRLIAAPHDVNYHMEHHLLAAVPSYNLPKLHRLLAARGFHDGADCISRGYGDVLRRAVAPEPGLANAPAAATAA